MRSRSNLVTSSPSNRCDFYVRLTSVLVLVSVCVGRGIVGGGVCCSEGRFILLFVFVFVFVLGLGLALGLENILKLVLANGLSTLITDLNLSLCYYFSISSIS